MSGRAAWFASNSPASVSCTELPPWTASTVIRHDAFRTWQSASAPSQNVSPETSLGTSSVAHSTNELSPVRFEMVTRLGHLSWLGSH